MYAVVCHDAGGAEIVSSYIRREGLDAVYSLEGPALGIFERKLGSVKSVSLEIAVNQASVVLCGTSWQSEIEVQAIEMAREKGKRTIAFLDHWVNYKERFERGSRVYLPDEIWVGDAIAETMAKNAFPTVDVVVVENPYFKDLKQELLNIEATAIGHDGLQILYVCEPVREHALRQYGDQNYWGYTEEGALRYFLSNIHLIVHNLKCILIRPHPSEPVEKYEWVHAEFDLPIRVFRGSTLLEQIVNSDIVAGCESMAMVVAMLADKRVISTIPPGGRDCILPQQGIERFKDIVN